MATAIERQAIRQQVIPQNAKRIDIRARGQRAERRTIELFRRGIFRITIEFPGFGTAVRRVQVFGEVEV